ncbi:MAG TPA: TOBE domain-containing protein [Rhizobium sp.]|nr:TOBE domain-containing protein [Rhizobium sp.]
MRPNSLRPVLDFRGADGHRAGEDRFNLLAAIDDTGSIAAAAKVVGLSYRAAWDAVNSLNNLFPRPIVIAAAGGRHGGGACVTTEGLRALTVHRLLTASIGEIIANLETTISGDPAVSFPAQSLLWSPIMKTSARNTYHGIVTDVHHGAINAEVMLKIAEDVTLTVMITEQSVANLNIVPGVEAYALIKASTPILMTETDSMRTSARNRICGAVVSVELGAVNAEVILDIGDGKTLCAIVTDDSAEALEIRPGLRLCALVKASQIILALA